MAEEQPRLYSELADWFHLLTAPDEYVEEAEFYRSVIMEAWQATHGPDGVPPVTLLELGSGGGNMATHLKAHFQVTLTDLSERMLALSRPINPECEHFQGDMRDLRLGRTFDLVFVHDAVVYLTTEADLRRAIETAFVHCRPGGVAIFAPDHVRETFSPGTDHGGNDGDGRALRYLEWSTDPDPTDTTYQVDYVYLLHEDGQPPRVEFDRHTEAMFPRADWLRWLSEAGFEATVRPLEHSEVEPGSTEIFIAVRPDG